MKHKDEPAVYNPQEIEQKWQKEWEEKGVYEPDMEPFDSAQGKPFYNLMMFPYPSAEGMHIGNMYAFTGADIYGRFKRMNGFNVFEPIGLDGFGIHSENYALKLGEHPKKVAARTEANFYRQLRVSGNSYSWKHILETYDPDYYKWTQWLFIQMFKKGLAYKAPAPVNFCPSCKTVLADEQVIPASRQGGDGRCERCSTAVEIKKLEQWFFKITKYADRLLKNIKKLVWPQKVLLGQKNWIGESVGAEIIFKVEGRDTPLHVFTTRLDTIYGVTAMVVATDKIGERDTPLALEIASKEQKNIVEKYILENKKTKNRTDKDEKTGVFTGSFAINPFSGEKVPIWVANYVVGWYGTGALMVVPAHDQRDFEFAKKYNLPIKKVIKTDQNKLPTTSYGMLVNSGEFTGLTSEEAIPRMTAYLEDTNQGKKQTQYKLRDWIISRQRYWGAPIPMIYCENCARLPSPDGEANGGQGWPASNALRSNAGWQPVPEDQLPVLLPDVQDWKPKGTGVSPLASVDEFVYTDCPKCKQPAKRETDVCDTFLDSSWYYLRYPSVNEGNSKSQASITKQIQNSNNQNTKKLEIGNWKLEIPWDPQITRRWLPVTQYIGGAEHTVLHLLYSRFVTMALHDMGYLDFDEPFPNFFAHGLIIKEGAKMSKSRGNVVIPDQYIKKYGVDSLRCYLMFLGPFDAGGDFRDTGMHGMFRFLTRIWRLVHDSKKLSLQSSNDLQIALHKTIKKVTGEITKFKYNTSIAAMMEFINLWEEEGKVLAKEDVASFIKLLSPFAPHLTEEIFHNLGYNTTIHKEKWPSYDPGLLIEEKVTIVIQVNGKLRTQIEIPQDLINEREQVIELALANETVQKYVKDKLQPKKIFYVPGRLINFVGDVRWGRS